MQDGELEVSNDPFLLFAWAPLEDKFGQYFHHLLRESSSVK